MKTDQQKTILLVEDNEPLNRAITFKLKARGYNVASVLNGEDALEVLKKEKVDFGWFGMLLPGMSGLELLRRLKSMDEHKDIKVAIISVSGGNEAQKQAHDLGAVDYIVKSDYDLGAIIDRVEKHIS